MYNHFVMGRSLLRAATTTSALQHSKEACRSSFTGTQGYLFIHCQVRQQRSPFWHRNMAQPHLFIISKLHFLISTALF